VADTGNSRVLEYDAPLTSNTTADRVFGQNGSFFTALPNNGGLSADSLDRPNSVALDAQDNLYAADFNNQRVMEYDVPVPHPAPTLTALSPATVATGSPTFTITVNGTGFGGSSSVRWNGSDRPTTYLSSTQLNALISAADLAGGGPFAITVFTPTPGGGTTTLMNVTLYARAGQDATADMEQGQPSFTDNTANNALMPVANHLNGPNGVAVDVHSGRLFVADENNNRVVSWPNAQGQANGQAPDLVLGQPDFAANGANNGGLSARSLNSPLYAAVDAQGNLYVADINNNRVLE
jgi:hypothetical protein